jgi:hypothetical protein
MEIIKRYKERVILCDENQIAVVWHKALLSLDCDIVGHRCYFCCADSSVTRWHEIRRYDTIAKQVEKELRLEHTLKMCDSARAAAIGFSEALGMLNSKVVEMFNSFKNNLEAYRKIESSAVYASPSRETDYRAESIVIIA